MEHVNKHLVSKAAKESNPKTGFLLLGIVGNGVRVKVLIDIKKVLYYRNVYCLLYHTVRWEKVTLI